MEASVECTHCGVVMTSWSAPGSTIRYFQCPFCARTHSSLYGEVFRRRAGVRIVEAPARPARPTEIPMASQDDVRWARVKATAARWFARVEADERRVASGAEARPLRARTRPARDDVPDVDPRDVVEIAPSAATATRKRR
jgi:hypothetical protein